MWTCKQAPSKPERIRIWEFHCSPSFLDMRHKLIVILRLHVTKPCLAPSLQMKTELNTGGLLIHFLERHLSPWCFFWKSLITSGWTWICVFAAILSALWWPIWSVALPFRCCSWILDCYVDFFFLVLLSSIFISVNCLGESSQEMNFIVRVKDLHLVIVSQNMWSPALTALASDVRLSFGVCS